MPRSRPVAVALGQVFRIPDFDPTTGEKRPYCQLDAKIREDYDLIRCMTESHFRDSSKVSSRLLDQCMPGKVVNVVYPDRIVVC